MGTWIIAGTAVLCVLTRGHDCQVRVRVMPWLRFSGDATALTASGTPVQGDDLVTHVQETQRILWLSRAGF